MWEAGAQRIENDIQRKIRPKGSGGRKLGSWSVQNITEEDNTLKEGEESCNRGKRVSGWWSVIRTGKKGG